MIKYLFAAFLLATNVLAAPLPPGDILRKQVLERLIMQRLQLQRAEQVGVRVGDDALNAALRQIANNNEMTLRQFRDVL